MNIKQGRVGGVLEARRIHDLCRERGVPVWCGGMLETGVGRALNLALAAMPGFTLPGDTSASARYFDEDLTAPFELAPDGTMAVPSDPRDRGHAAPGTTPGMRDPARARASLIERVTKPSAPLDGGTGPPVWFAVRDRWSPRVPAVSHFPGRLAPSPQRDQVFPPPVHTVVVLACVAPSRGRR